MKCLMKRSVKICIINNWDPVPSCTLAPELTEEECAAVHWVSKEQACEQKSTEDPCSDIQWQPGQCVGAPDVSAYCKGSEHITDKDLCNSIPDTWIPSKCAVNISYQMTSKHDELQVSAWQPKLCRERKPYIVSVLSVRWVHERACQEAIEQASLWVPSVYRAKRWNNNETMCTGVVWEEGYCQGDESITNETSCNLVSC